MKKLPFWRISYFLEHYLTGDHLWGSIRFFSLVLLSLFFMLLSVLIFEQHTISQKIFQWKSQNPFLLNVPASILFFVISFTTWDCLRYLIPSVAAVFWAALAGSRYVQDIYELPNFKDGFNYIKSAAFSIDYPRLTIEHGKKKIDPKEVNLIDKIGGPGFVNIKPGNVVLFERLDGVSDVAAGKRHFITRHERVKEIASLEDQHGHIENLVATTKDGIQINIRDIHFRYRLRSGRMTGDYAARTPEDPYPFSVQAVRNMAYNRNVRANGIVSWHDAIRQVVESVITAYITKHKFDDVTTPMNDAKDHSLETNEINPPQLTSEIDPPPLVIQKYLTQIDIEKDPSLLTDENDTLPSANEKDWPPKGTKKDPRLEIAKSFNSAGTRQRLKNLGADLLWFDIGHFEIANKKVTEQRLGTWSARWIGNATVQRAMGEARRLANQEQGRAEAQSEILISIIHSLEEARWSGDSSRNIRNLILVRTAQLLEALNDTQDNDSDQGQKTE
jgi:hypothetical protein